MRLFAFVALTLFAALPSPAETVEALLTRDEAARAGWAALPITLTGRIVDEDGFGVQASLRVQEKEAVADSRGWFSLEGLARRNALLTVTAKGYFTEVRVADLEVPASDARNRGYLTALHSQHLPTQAELVMLVLFAPSLATGSVTVTCRPDMTPTDVIVAVNEALGDRGDPALAADTLAVKVRVCKITSQRRGPMA